MNPLVKILNRIKENKRQRRLNHLTGGLSKTMLGLEIGASHNPLCPKKDGWNVKTLDYASTEDLIKISSTNENVDTNKIEEVDFVLKDGDMLNTILNSGDYKFDYIISSHVIEHSTCFISYLRMLEKLLINDGIGILAIPNKLCCFAAYKPLTNTADVIYNFENEAKKHSSHKIRQMLLCNITNNKVDGWASYQDLRNYEFLHSLNDNDDKLQKLISKNKDSYVDIHEWYFIPSSFELIMFELYALELTSMKISKLVKGNGEFFVFMSRSENNLGIVKQDIEKQRLIYYKKVIEEQYSAYKQMLHPNIFTTIKNKLISHLKLMLKKNSSQSI